MERLIRSLMTLNGHAVGNMIYLTCVNDRAHGYGKWFLTSMEAVLFVEAIMAAPCLSFFP